MAATTDSLRELHLLHQRAKALRDRLESGPKTLAARRAALAKRRDEVEKARKAVQDLKLGVKKAEHALQAAESKIEDLTVKLNQAKKNDEYKAIQNQIAHDKAAKSKHEDEILAGYEKIEAQAVSLAAVEKEAEAFAGEAEKLEADLEAQAVGWKTQLAELEAGIVEAERAIPPAQREQYRRIVRRFGADALAAVEGGACLGCYTTITPQMVNELINHEALTFCKSCGRLLYRGEEDPEPATSRKSARR